MAYREPTQAELEAAEREIMQRRGERILAAEAAAKTEAKQKAERIAKLRADPTAPRVEIETGTRRLTTQQQVAPPDANRYHKRGIRQVARELGIERRTIQPSIPSHGAQEVNEIIPFLPFSRKK